MKFDSFECVSLHEIRIALKTECENLSPSVSNNRLDLVIVVSVCEFDFDLSYPLYTPLIIYLKRIFMLLNVMPL